MFRRFIIGLSSISFAIAVAAFFVFHFIQPLKGLYPSTFPYILGFVYLVTLAFHYFLLVTYRSRAEKFPARFMGGAGIKLFAYIIFLAILLLLSTDNKVVILLSFLFIYLIFTTFEVVSVLCIFRRKS
jgi:hypothetical protein